MVELRGIVTEISPYRRPIEPGRLEVLTGVDLWVRSTGPVPLSFDTPGGSVVGQRVVVRVDLDVSSGLNPPTDSPLRDGPMAESVWKCDTSGASVAIVGPNGERFEVDWVKKCPWGAAVAFGLAVASSLSTADTKGLCEEIVHLMAERDRLRRLLLLDSTGF